jgi:hypothetical protein
MHPAMRTEVHLGNTSLKIFFFKGGSQGDFRTQRQDDPGQREMCSGSEEQSNRVCS